MKKNKGSNLVEYIIPTALVGTVVGLGLYNIFTNNSLLDYIMASCNMSVSGNTLMSKNTSSSASTGSTGSNGSTKTTIGNATTECKDNTCSIDFGNLKLTGVPQDIKSLVETSGTAAATDSILALLQQVADQIEQTDPEEAKKIETLIARGKEIMNLEKNFESWYENNESLLLNYSDSIEQFYAKKDEITEKYASQMTCKESSNIDSSEYSIYYTDIVENYSCTFKTKKAESAYNNEIDKAYNSIIQTPNQTLLASIQGEEKISINGQTIPYYGVAWDAIYLLNPTAVLHIDKDGYVDFTGNKIDFNTTTASQFNDMISGKIDYEYYKNPQGLSSEFLESGTFTTSPVGYYVTELKNVLQNSNNTEVKNITTQLSQEIFNIASSVSEKSSKIDSYIWDYLNRDSYNYKIPTNDAAITTNLDLNIICASNGGQYDNTTKECK